MKFNQKSPNFSLLSTSLFHGLKGRCHFFECLGRQMWQKNKMNFKYIPSYGVRTNIFWWTVQPGLVRKKNISVTIYNGLSNIVCRWFCLPCLPLILRKKKAWPLRWWSLLWNTMSRNSNFSPSLTVFFFSASMVPLHAQWRVPRSFASSPNQHFPQYQS